ncbi:hypothetical protein QBC40DRAFT_288918 [Triangularia verruculosa]|uniref:Uncharacterized protein n=1 Tax=Triangularia verruculosa TaxID=2587418 RepID=A0AAN7AQL6_9PEZI|nr:hypothetical protein QBC40DRAFT_288918 [Triangularia verruculosa]
MIWKMIFNSVNVDIPIPEHDALRPYVPYFSSPEPRFSDEYKAYFGWRQSLEEGISSTHNPFNSPLSNAPSVTLNAPANPFVPLLIQAPATGQKRQASESPLTGNASPAKKECNQLADRELLNGETPLLELIELKASFKESRLQFFEAQTSGNNHDVNTKAVVLSPTAETQVQKLYLAEIKMTASEREQLGDSFTARIGAKDGSLIKVEVKICSST